MEPTEEEKKKAEEEKTKKEAADAEAKKKAEEEEAAKKKEADKKDGDASGQKGGKGGEWKPPATKEEFDSAVQDQVTKIAKSIREDERKSAEKEAEQKRLAAAGEWEKIASQKENDLTAVKATLEAVKQELVDAGSKMAAMQKALKGILDSERQGLDKAVLELLDKLSEVEQLDWIGKNRDALKGVGLQSLGKTGADGKGGQASLSAEEQAKAQKAATDYARRTF